MTRPAVCSCKLFLTLFFIPLLLPTTGLNDPDHLSQLKKELSSVVFLENPQNLGFGPGLNKGIQYLRSQNCPDFFYILGSDISVEKSALETCQKELEAHPDIGLLPSLMKDANGELDLNVWKTNTYRDYLRRCFFFSERRLIRKSIASLGEIQTSDPFDCFYIRGSFMAVRLAALSSRDLFDPSIFLYEDDKAACVRIRGNGFRVCAFSGFTYQHLHDYSRQRKVKFRNPYLQFMKIYMKVSWIKRVVFSCCFGLGHFEKKCISSLARLKNHWKHNHQIKKGI